MVNIVASPDSKPGGATVVTTKKEPSTSRIPWQRITLSIFGIAIVLFVWRWATNHLYTLPVTSISAFASITTNTMYVIAALVIFFVTGQVIYAWSNQTTSSIVQEARSYFGQSKENVDITEHVIAPKHFDDLATIP